MTVDSAFTNSALSDDALQEQASRLGALLLNKRLSVATAESCTGGWIAKTFTDVSGSSAWFYGGIVSYSNEAKQNLLGVTGDTLADHGAVSSEVVSQMALGALDALGAQCAVSVSGVAGPGGGTAAKPVGLVWIGVAVKGGVASSVDTTSLARKHHFDGSRDLVRRATVVAAIELIAEVLESA
ncbi:MAG: CinA family protein [Gammaproteobacteria bacterium]